MENVVKKSAKSEKGAALILVLVVLLVGGLIAGGLLQHMGAGLLSGEVYNRRTAELYAADAGVEDAIWKIQRGETSVCPADPHSSYNITDLNGRTVQISIEYIDGGIYRITSTAVTADDGNTAALVSATTVESYVSALYMDFSSLLDYAIVSNETIDIQPNVCVNGSVWLPYEEDLTISPNSEITGDNLTLNDGISLTWPTFRQLSQYYWGDVKHLEEEAYPAASVVDIRAGTAEGDPHVIGPLLAEGDLTIKGDGWVKLNGTVYVKGDLLFKATSQINLNLNHQTIFAEGDIDIPPGVSLSGSGCIIAAGDIRFRPGISSNPEDFVLVMSIEGTATVQPNGDFTGCIVGNEVVQLQPAQGEDFTITWINPEGKGLDFPMGMGNDPNELPPATEVGIKSWEIQQQ
jgi:cytoskeletal protein CcmA (bactofilin family)